MKSTLTWPGENAFISSASFRTAWSRRWRAYDEALLRCRKKASPEEVHALRVASRQLLALLAVITEDAPNADAQFRPILEKVLRKSTRLRDLQVEVKVLASLPAGDKQREWSLQRLKAQAHKRRQKFSRRLRRGLGEHPDPERWLERNPLPAPKARFLAVLTRVLERTRAAARAQLARVRSAGPRTRHRIRLALKAHRYLCEAVLRPGVRGAELALLRSAQSAMGDRRDFERLRRRLRRWGESNAKIRRLARRNAAAWSRREERLVAVESQSRQSLLLRSSLGTDKKGRTKSP